MSGAHGDAAPGAVGTGAAVPAVRRFAAALAAVFVALAVNWGGITWLGGATIDGDAFYDVCAAFLTLLIPAIAGGLAAGWIAREEGTTVAAVVFLLWCAVGFFHPFWRIPPVSPHAATSRFLHYLIANPLTALAFGWLGAWIGSQFSTGRFTLADPEPVRLPEE